MGIFKRKVAAQRAERVVDAVFTNSERDRIQALWRLTALPRVEFDTTYGVMLERVLVLRGRSRRRGLDDPQGRGADMRDGCAGGTPAACVAPVRRAGEEGARLHEVMSFALTAAVVAERFGQVAGRACAPDWCPLTEDVPASVVFEDVAVRCCYGALLLRMVGDGGLAWLGQEPVAMRELAAYFGEGSSELRAIVGEAAVRVGLVINVPATAAAPGVEEL